jgi:acetyl-CoA C-acetyltransferase
MRRQKSLAREVALVGAGMSKFGVFKEKTSRELFVEAYQAMAASVDRGFDPREIDSIYVANFSSDRFESQGHLAPILADAVGLVPLPATRIEDACASGGAALRQGVMAIASGLADVVLVGGVERMSPRTTGEVTDILAAAGDMLYEMSPAGFTFPSVFAAMATAYMARYGMRPEHLMRVAQKAHANGAFNPKAQFNRSLGEIMQARRAALVQKGQPDPGWTSELDFLHDPAANPPVAWPLRLFDCTPITDGAACLLLASAERAREFTDEPLHIIGSGQASDTALAGHADLTRLQAARLAAQEAYVMAGVRPEDVRLAEVHDCFTIAEVIAMEDLGFFAPGTGFQAVADGLTCRDGPRPINTSGGLKAKGHPVGASGVAQVVEIWEQLRGEAGPRQVPGSPALALAHNLGGTGATCVVHIFERKG